MEEFQSYHSAFFLTCFFSACTLPLISFVLSFIISEKYSWIVSFSAPLLQLISCLAAAIVFYWIWNHPPFTIQWDWFSIGGMTLHAGIFLNTISGLMLLVVTFISFLVHIYSTGYMAGDADIRKYFAMLGFFTFAMLGIVVSDNLLLIFVFWELVGFSSYMLIGHWNEKPKAADAAKRAFILNRIGDAGFLIGLMILYTTHHTFDLQQLIQISSDNQWGTAASLCIFCGVMGKSAQFPLFTWLPDAMEGPTPVSALIHAATMVAAGVFLMERVHFLFTPVALDVVTITGCITALAGALAALVQYDMKKILAYSTISQLGFMVIGMGTGSPEAAMLHLFTHAFFKASLFLGAGAVIHSLHQAQHQSHVTFDVQDTRNLGGLQKKLPFTFIIFVLSGSALAGLPFFSGFLSKDAILTSLVIWKGDNFSWRWVIVFVAFIVTFLTAVYTFRLIWSIFRGNEKFTQGLSISEPPPAMRAPMALLAAASLWMIVSWNPFSFAGWIYNALHREESIHFTALSIISALWILMALAFAYWTKDKKFSSRMLYEAFYFDRLYRFILEPGVFQVARATENTDKKWIDGFLHTSAYLQLMTAHVVGWFDRAIVDGVVNGMAQLARGTGSLTRMLQGGKIQLYIFWSIFSIIIFIIWTLL